MKTCSSLEIKQKAFGIKKEPKNAKAENLHKKVLHKEDGVTPRKKHEIFNPAVWKIYAVFNYSTKQATAQYLFGKKLSLFFFGWLD